MRGEWCWGCTERGEPAHPRREGRGHAVGVAIAAGGGVVVAVAVFGALGRADNTGVIGKPGALAVGAARVLFGWRQRGSRASAAVAAAF